MAPLEVRWLKASVDEVRRQVAVLVNIAKRSKLADVAVDLKATEEALQRISRALAAEEESHG